MIKKHTFLFKDIEIARYDFNNSISRGVCL